MTTRNTTIADGVSPLFSVPFDYLDRTHVKVALDDVVAETTAYSFVTDGTISISPTPVAGTRVTVYRETPGLALTTYQSGSVLTRDQLEVDSLQALYRIEELDELSVRANPSDPVVDLTLPEASGGQLIGWTSDGLGLRNVDPTGSGDLTLRSDLLEDSGADLIGVRQSGTGAVLRTLGDKASDSVSVLDYIPVAQHAAIKARTSTYDCSADITRALAAHEDVYVPPGTYVLRDSVSIPGGRRLYGQDRQTKFTVNSDFNMAATGVFVFAGGEPGPILEGVTVSFGQPNTTNIADYYQYPPCVHAVGRPRFKVQHCRFERPWVGIDMTGNAGGSFVFDVEMSPMFVGIDIDGSADSVKLSQIHMWPFGLGSGQRSIFDAAYGIRVGRCDDFHLSDSLLFSQVNAAYFTDHGNGKVFGQITNTGFDARGGLHLLSGSLQVSNCYFSIAHSDAICINVGSVLGNTALLVSNSQFYIPINNPTANGYVQATNGSALQLNNCRFSTVSLNKSTIYCSASSLQVTGCDFERTSGVSYSAETIWLASGQGVIQGNLCSLKGAGSGNFVKEYTNSGYIIRDNNLRGWGINTTGGTLSNTISTGNLGGAAGSNKEEFAGFFDSTATTSNLPAGWTVTKQAQGRYFLNHNMGLASTRNVVLSLVSCTAGIVATVDLSDGSLDRWRIVTQTTAGADADAQIMFTARRSR